MSRLISRAVSLEATARRGRIGLSVMRRSDACMMGGLPELIASIFGAD
jgi:hypothetical protein